MKLTEVEKVRLYNAMADPIVDLRAQVQDRKVKADDIDLELFLLPDRIWQALCNELKIEDME